MIKRLTIQLIKCLEIKFEKFIKWKKLLKQNSYKFCFSKTSALFIISSNSNGRYDGLYAALNNQPALQNNSNNIQKLVPSDSNLSAYANLNDPYALQKANELTAIRSDINFGTEVIKKVNKAIQNAVNERDNAATMTDFDRWACCIKELKEIYNVINAYLNSQVAQAAVLEETLQVLTTMADSI